MANTDFKSVDQYIATHPADVPAYKLHGIAVATADLVAAFKDDLAPYEFNSKGTIRFPLSQPVPVKRIERIAKFRAKEAAERARAKRARPKKR
jgi:uncharacterized protein YdhG (YjbR/CyaY superfamily)